MNRGEKSSKSVRTIRDDCKLIWYNDLCLIVTSHVSLAIRKNEPDSVGSNGIAADQVAGAEGSEAKSQPDDLAPPMSGSYGQTHPRRFWSVPATNSRAFPAQHPVAEHLEDAPPFVSSARFEGVRKAGLSHATVVKPAYPW